MKFNGKDMSGAHSKFKIEVKDECGKWKRVCSNISKDTIYDIAHAMLLHMDETAVDELLLNSEHIIVTVDWELL